MLHCDSRCCGAILQCCSAIQFALDDSGMILHSPSRFVEAAMVDIDIGYFGDERLRKGGELLIQRIAERQAVCLRQLGDDRAEQVKFRRFLLNDSVTVGNGTDVGLFVHPVLVVDAGSKECLGLVGAQVWRRRKRKAANYKSLPIERKESCRWLKGGEQAKAALTAAAMVTILDDREGDIYEKWARLPDRRTHLLT